MHTGREIRPLTTARQLKLAVDPLSSLPLAGQLDERIPAQVGMALMMLVELIAVVVVMASRLPKRGRPEAVRECDSAL